MAREIRLIVSCDGAPGEPCQVEVSEDSTPHHFTWAGVTYSRDLCTLHTSEFQTIMQALVEVSYVDEQVRPKPKRAPGAGGPGRPRGPMPATTCRFCNKSLSAQTLLRHTDKYHTSEYAKDMSLVASLQAQVTKAKTDFKAGVSQT